MSGLSKLERKFGRFAIKNLTLYLIIGYIIGYLLEMFAPNVIAYLYLNPCLVIENKEIWRIFTWIITPPSTLSIWTIIMLFFYYSIGSLLERTMGSFLYNIYVFGGMFLTMAGSILVYVFCVHVFKVIPDYSIFLTYVPTYYILLSLFLAVAACYPNMEVLYAAIIPVKMKWLAIVYLVFVAYYLVKGNFMGRVVIILSLLNFAIFFLTTINMRKFSPKQIKRKRSYTKQVKVNKADNVGHRCAICGLTDKDDPTMTFRYCSKCAGNREYCTEHLFTHEHILR